MKSPKEFLEYNYGIVLTEKSAIINPLLLVEIMEEYTGIRYNAN